MSEREKFEGYCILELMGHRRLAGYLSEQEIAGHGFLRLDIPAAGEHEAATQFYSPSAVYAITPTSMTTATAFASAARPAPVSIWDLPRALPESAAPAPDEEEDDGVPY